MVLPSRSQLIRDSALTKTDRLEIATCRGEPQRLGFAYQLGFVQVFQRFPVQQPLEICEELQSFIALQTGIDAELPLGTATPVPHPARAAESRAVDALARDVYYGRRGRINARELHEQMNSCSCLTLILACIIYWQAKQITRTMLSGDLAQEGIGATLIQYISPIEWDNVILYGQYVLDRALVR